MEWLTVAGTLGGTILGVGSTLVAEGLRGRRERRLRLDEVRRTAYAQFLLALTSTDAAMQALVGRTPGPVPTEAAVEAFRSERLLASRYELDLVAPAEVGEAAAQAYRRLRDIREAMIAEHLVISTSPARDNARTEGWRAVHRPCVAAVDQLRGAMQREAQAA